MSNALEAASLVMIPSGYEDGTLGSLKPTDGSGDFTFSRGSNLSATRINEQGYIEKGYENLLLQSNSFDTTWTKSSTSVTGGQAGYDGSNDAWLLEALATTAARVEQPIVSNVCTLTIYAKSGTTNWMFLNAGTGGSVYFDIENGVVGNTSSQNIDASITSIGNGWYRVTSVVPSTTFFRIYPASGNGQLATAGDNIYIQDAMLNQGLVAYPYIETTTAPVAGGILEDMPRLDWSGSCPSLLLEPSRTNVVTHSEYFGGNASAGSISFTYNDSTSPEGITNAALVSASASGDRIQPSFAAINGLVCISIFLKHNGTDFTTQINTFNTGDTSLYGVTASVTSSGVTFSSYQSGYDSADFVDYGNGWFRVYVVCQSTTGNTFAQWRPTTGSSVSYPCYGFQCEAGSYPTSYIPTYGVSQTRLADVCVDAGDASTFNDSEGVLFFEGSALANVNTGANFLSIAGANASNDRISIGFVTGRRIVEIKTNNVTQMLYTQITDISQISKLAINYKENDCKFYINGVLIHSDTSVNLPINLQQLNFSKPSAFNFYGNVNQVLYFPTALSDSECIALTTIT